MNHSTQKLLKSLTFLGMSLLSAVSWAAEINLTVSNNSEKMVGQEFSLYAYQSNNKTLREIQHGIDYYTLHITAPEKGSSISGILSIPDAWVDSISTTVGCLTKTRNDWVIIIND